MLTTYAAGSATMLPIASCSFVFRVVGFIINDLKKKKKKKKKKSRKKKKKIGERLGDNMRFNKYKKKR